VEGVHKRAGNKIQMKIIQVDIKGVSFKNSIHSVYVRILAKECKRDPQILEDLKITNKSLYTIVKKTVDNKNPL